MARTALTDEYKQGKINEYLHGKEQKVLTNFEEKVTIDDKYKYMLYLIRTSKPKVDGTTSDESTIASVVGSLSTLLKKKLSTGDLNTLRTSLASAITTIDEKIEGNKKADDIKKLSDAIAAMELAGLNATDAKAKLEELKK